MPDSPSPAQQLIGDFAPKLVSLTVARELFEQNGSRA